MTGNTDMHLLVTDTLEKKVGCVDQKNSQYLVWPLVYNCRATHLLHIELIRLLIVACGLLSHSSSMAVRICWILAGTGTRCRTRWSRASQTCSMGDTSGETADHGISFQLPGTVYRCLWHGAVHYRAETWSDSGRWMARQWASGSRHGFSVHLNCHR